MKGWESNGTRVQRKEGTTDQGTKEQGNYGMKEWLNVGMEDDKDTTLVLFKTLGTPPPWDKMRHLFFFGQNLGGWDWENSKNPLTNGF